MTEAKVYQQILVELKEKQKTPEIREVLAKKHGVSLEEIAMVECMGEIPELRGWGGKYGAGPMEGALKFVLPLMGIGVEEPIEEPFEEYIPLSKYKGKIQMEQYEAVVQEKMFEIFTALYKPIIALYLAELKQFGRILEGEERKKQAGHGGCYIHRKELEGK